MRPLLRRSVAVSVLLNYLSSERVGSNMGAPPTPRMTALQSLRASNFSSAHLEVSGREHSISAPQARLASQAAMVEQRRILVVIG